MAATRRTLRAFVLQREWRAGPPVYSDINFILLGIALERLLGMPMAEMPMAPGLTFRPDPARAAATEHCTWRGRVLVGEVHDENAFALGGSGHAGLFGTVDGVLDYAHGLLDGTGAPEGAIRLMRTPIAGNRTHGWGEKISRLVRRRRLVPAKRSAIPASPAPACGSTSPAASPGRFLPTACTRHGISTAGSSGCGSPPGI